MKTIPVNLLIKFFVLIAVLPVMGCSLYSSPDRAAFDANSGNIRPPKSHQLKPADCHAISDSRELENLELDFSKSNSASIAFSEDGVSQIYAAAQSPNQERQVLCHLEERPVPNDAELADLLEKLTEVAEVNVFNPDN